MQRLPGRMQHPANTSKLPPAAQHGWLWPNRQQRAGCTAVGLSNQQHGQHRCMIASAGKGGPSGSGKSQGPLPARPSSRLPGDSGWDPFKLRKNEPKTFNKFREIEIIHARWAMLGVLALVLSDMAGTPFYPPAAGNPSSFATLVPWGVVGALLVALIESYRMAALWDEEDFDSRAYPGKQFDVLGVTKGSGGDDGQPPGLGVYSAWVGGLAGWLLGGWWFQRRDMTEQQLLDMKSRELKSGRLAMMSFLGCCLASLLTGKGPYTLLLEHISDPVHHTIVQALFLS